MPKQHPDTRSVPQIGERFNPTDFFTEKNSLPIPDEIMRSRMSSAAKMAYGAIWLLGDRHQKATAALIAEAIGITEKQARRALKELSKAGLYRGGQNA